VMVTLLNHLYDAWLKHDLNGLHLLDQKLHQ
jgi:hypothetical protein